MLTWILSFLGGGPLSKVLDALGKAHADSLNARTVSEKTAADERVATLTQLAADTANARASAKLYPFWLAMIAWLFGIGFALHSFFIAIGTAFQPLIVGGWADWLLHIPKLPPPYDATEAAICGFFYGFAAISVGTGAIAAAIGRRKS